MKNIVVLILGLALLLCMVSPALAAKKDSSGPIVTGSNPYDYQRNVLVESKLIIRFNEAIQKGRLFTMIKMQDSNGNVVGCSCEVKDNVLQVWPKKKLKYATEYHVVVPDRAVKDASGNELEKQYAMVFNTESESTANGSIAEEQVEASKSTHTIDIDTVMGGALSNADKSYLIAVFQSLGIQVNNIRVNEIEENADGKPEETEDITDEVVTEEEVENTDEAEEYDQFDLYLVDAGPQKIQVIKVVREITSLGLREAKDLVDGVEHGPRIVKERIASDEADQCSRLLEEQGATTLIVGHGESAD